MYDGKAPKEARKKQANRNKEQMFCTKCYKNEINDNYETQDL